MEILIIIIVIAVIVSKTSSQKKQSNQKKSEATHPYRPQMTQGKVQSKPNTYAAKPNTYTAKPNTYAPKPNAYQLKEKSDQDARDRKAADVRKKANQDANLNRAKVIAAKKDADDLKILKEKVYTDEKIRKQVSMEADADLLMKEVYDLIATGYNGEMTFPRDFIGEGIDMLAKIQG